MDTLDFGNISYNELYKLHTGHAVYDSDSDSSDSTSSSFFEKNTPPLYSLKELIDNSVEPSSTQSETDLNISDSDGSNKVLGIGFQPQHIITKELEKLVLQNSCILCNVIDRCEHDIRGHRNGRAHKMVVEQYIKDRMEILQSGKNVERVCNSGFSQSSSFTSNTITSSKLTPNSTESLGKPDTEKTQAEKEQEKLKKLMLPAYCYVCSAVLSQPANAFSHYNSMRHKNNVGEWKVTGKALEEKRQEKLKQLMLPTYCYVCCADLSHPDNAFSHYNSMRHKNNVREWKDKSLDEILQEKLYKLIRSNYCSICYASLPHRDQAQSHYSSERHKDNVDIWKSTELEKLQPSRIDNLVPICQSNEPNTDIKTVEPNVIPRCMVSGINVGTGLQEHYQSDLHKRSVETFCFVCNITIISRDQLAEHVKSAWHINNLGIKSTENDNLAIPQTIVVKEDSASVSNTQDNSYVYNDKNKNYSTVNTIKILQNKDESPNLLQNQVQSEMEKLKNTIKSIPPNTALTFLQKYVKELENLKEETKALTINVKNVVSRDIHDKNVFEHKSFIKNRFEHGTPEEHRYVRPDNLNLRNVSEPKTSDYSHAKLLTLGAAGMLILYYLKK